MSPLCDVENFVQAITRVTDFDGLRRLLGEIVKSLGFDYFALVHHVDLSRIADDFVSLADYPQTWIEAYLGCRYYCDDPVLVTAQKSATPFLWTDVPRLIAQTVRQEEIWRGACRAGLGDGVTVPIHIPGEFTGSCSFCMRAGRPLPVHSLPIAQYLGCFAFQAARRLVQMNMASRTQVKPARQPLSPRQLDCVILAGRGKSDRVVGQLLGISGETVHQHIEEAKRRFNVATRQQLIVSALFDSQITYADLMNRQASPDQGNVAPGSLLQNSRGGFLGSLQWSASSQQITAATTPPR